MTGVIHTTFRPREGAHLDLRSLEVLATAPSDALVAWLAARCPGATGLILEGLDLQGDVAPSGPPGAVRPDALVGGAVITPGRALITGRDDRLHLLELPEAIHVPWPDASGARVRGQLVLYTAAQEGVGEAGIAVAREDLEVRLGFVKPDTAPSPYMLPLAHSVGNGQDWATDIARVLQPEHDIVRQLAKRLERIEVTVWQAEPEGAVWDRQVLGRSWVRYQTVAASVLQAAALQIQTLALTTQERVRLLTTLRAKLERSVEPAATELLQLVGSPDGAGPYAAVLGLDV